MASRSASSHASEPSRGRSARRRPATIVSGSPIPEQAGEHGGFAAEHAQVDARRVREQHHGEGRLGERLRVLAEGGEVDEAEDLGAEQEPAAGEHHRRRDGRARDPAGDRRVPDQRDREAREGPLHAPTLSRPPTLRPGFTRVNGRAIDAGSAPREHALPMGRPTTVRR